MRKFFALAALAVAAVATPAQATIVFATKLTVTHYFVYDHNIGVQFQFIGGALAGCTDGAWIPSTSPGYKSLFATLLAAKALGNTITLYLDNDPSTLWPGGGSYCKVSTIMME